MKNKYRIIKDVTIPGTKNHWVQIKFWWFPIWTTLHARPVYEDIANIVMKRMMEKE